MRCKIGARKKNACNRLEDGVYLVTLVNPDRLFLKFDARLVFEIRVLHACLHRPMHVERLVLADNSSASAIDATKLENISHSVVSGGGIRYSLPLLFPCPIRALDALAEGYEFEDPPPLRDLELVVDFRLGI